jgi:hypothetical protein
MVVRSGAQLGFSIRKRPGLTGGHWVSVGSQSIRLETYIENPLQQAFVAGRN